MSFKDEIAAAVGAHGMWKSKLKDAIQTGKSDAVPAIVRMDDKCKFGQWLHGAAIPASAKSAPGYRECVDLHAKFHVAAAKVLEFALAGKKAEAQAAIAMGSEFASLSAKLTDAMMRWQKVA